MKSRVAIAWVLFGSVLMLIPFKVFLKVSPRDSSSRAVSPELARLSDRITVHAAGQGAPRITLSDGREVLAAYLGDPEAERLLQQNLVQPLAIASSDFDGDGVPDLVSGYAAPNGGVLTLHRGNIDSIHPNALQARQRKAAGAFTESPFLSPARALNTPRPVDFIGCGDFNSDGRLDVVTAARGDRALYLFQGDGHGNLVAASETVLPGRITALANVEINHRDGTSAIAVAISEAPGARLLLFDSSRGVTNPETIALPTTASALVPGRFTNEFESEVAVAAGNTLSLIRVGGAGAKKYSRILKRSFPFSIMALAVGDFTGNHRTELSMLTDDDEVRLLSVPLSFKKSPSKLKEWSNELLSTKRFSGASRLVTARLSTLSRDTVIVVNPSSHGLHLLTRDTAMNGLTTASPLETVLEAENQPAAVLPMRLNLDGIDDLVVLAKGRTAPSTILTAPASVFTVTNTSDTGLGSLRDAIDQANLAPGADFINFNPGLGTINVGSITGMPLPDIIDTLTIDGGSPRIELNGTAAGAGANGLTISASNVVVQGLVINRFGSNGIGLQGLASIVQDNFIGTDAAGTSALPNGGSGILITGLGNSIGGTAPTSRNVISGNSGVGIELNGGEASTNLIEGNFIGTDVSGSNALGNGVGGIEALIADETTIGGTSAGAGNTIAFNGLSGIAIFGGLNNAILGNSIFSNSFLGIDLEDEMVTPNDPCDPDTGANNLQNYPMLTSATFDGMATTIVGSLDSVASSTYRVEFFSNSTCDPSGFGQGRTFIGSVLVNTDASCLAPINVVLPVAVTPGQVITATATDNTNNSSEFSQCVTVTGVGTGSDLQISMSDSPDPVMSGSNITYTITVTNNGPDTDAGVTFTGTVPAGTTFVSLTSTGSCAIPPLGGAGTISCLLGPLNSGGSVPISLVVNVNAASGATITNVATVTGSSSDPNLANNSVSASTTVVSGPCVLSCSSDLVVFTSSTSSSCGTVVTYPLPVFTGDCGELSCTPSPGSFFAVGTTTVACTLEEGIGCSFAITVFDDTPPSISCSTGVAVPLPAGQLSAVVNYPAPTATDNCTVTEVVCVPPSGSTFPAGATLVTCTARDASDNANRCFFFVTVIDAESPVIRCPGNVSTDVPAGQTSAVVTYPAPTVSDNLPGVTVVCSPPSGSTFPLGATTVTCTATDAGANKSSCSFVVGVGAPQVKVTIPGNKPAVEFEAAARRKPPKPKNSPCSFFTIENIGFSPLVLTFDSLKRTGADVSNGRITDPNDVNAIDMIPKNKFFILSLVNPDGSSSQLGPGSTVTVQPGEAQPFCLRFAALIPGLVGKTTGLAASDVLPDLVTSTIIFRQNAGANIQVPILARVATAVILINPSNPRKPPVVTFARSGNDITVSYAVFDSNLDVNRAKYEFLDASGQVIAGPFEIDLAASISSANLVRGQSFSIDQRFTGASSNPEITAVRLTVFDGETSAVFSSSASTALISDTSIESIRLARYITLHPPDVKLVPVLP